MRLNSVFNLTLAALYDYFLFLITFRLNHLQHALIHLCALCLRENQSFGSALKRWRQLCVEISVWPSLCAFVLCVTFLGGCGCVGLGYCVCSCQRMFFLLFFLLFSPSDDTHFHSPFTLKFLWLELIVLATADCPSTRLKCHRKEEAENIIWSQNGIRDDWESGIVLELPSFQRFEVYLWEFFDTEDTPRCNG